LLRSEKASVKTPDCGIGVIASKYNCTGYRQRS
jgi:hypothetical protein